MLYVDTYSCAHRWKFVANYSAAGRSVAAEIILLNGLHSLECQKPSFEAHLAKCHGRAYAFRVALLLI
jgi:hypothetical protein